MTEVLFYHLEHSTLEQVLPRLLEKSLERGAKVAVLTSRADQLEALDEALWTYRDDSFLPHATLTTSSNAGKESILLSLHSGEELAALPNQPEIVFLVHNASISYAEAKIFSRCVVMFDGRDDEALNRARQLWKKLRDAHQQEDKNEQGNEDADFSQTYWRQNQGGGGWEKQA